MCQYGNITVCPCLIVRLDGCIMIHHHSSQDLKIFQAPERGSPHHHGFPKAHALWPSHMHWWHISLPGCRNLAVILHFLYTSGNEHLALSKKRVLFPNHLGRGYIFASHVFPRTFRWAKCQAPLPGIQSLMMSCANGWGRLYTSCGKWPRRTASICLFRFQRISTTLGGSCTIFYQIYCSWIQSCGIRNSKIHE